MNDIQKVLLNIFLQTAAVCEALNLRYFAIGGTAIGAVRHNGFIPWDDDLDIALPIEDYELFLNKAQALLPDYLYIRTYRDATHNSNVFSKVCDMRTTNIEPHEAMHPEDYKGVFIDIMPMSGVPCGMRKFGFLWRIHFYDYLLRTLPWSFADKRNLRGKLFWLLFYPLRFITNAHAVLERWERLLDNNPFNSACNVGYTWSPWIDGLIFPKQWFEDYVSLPFEGYQIRMPSHYHAYLTHQFGNYMDLPPQGQRYTHNGFIDLDHSYVEYRDGLLTIPSDYLERGGEI